MQSRFIQGLPINDFPREKVNPQTILMLKDIPTDRAFLLNKGSAKGRDGCLYQAGQAINFKEFLAFPTYETPVVCLEVCELIYLPREFIKDNLSSASPITWTLARSLALDHLMVSVLS
jgi:hypothetical protein